MLKYIVADLPRVGLCNKIHIWAHGLVYSNLHNVPFYVNGWAQFRIAPYIRNERVKRYYVGYFYSRSNYFQVWLYKLFLCSRILKNPELSRVNVSKFELVIFDQIPLLSKTDNIFKSLVEHRELIRKSFFEMLSKDIKNKYLELDCPDIGVHIRRGDFVLLGQATDEEYYIKKIDEIRSEFGQDLSVQIFSDGYDQEILNILKLKKTSLVRHDKDILDLLHLSKSKFIVKSPRSTFSLWAAFLSNSQKVV